MPVVWDDDAVTVGLGSRGKTFAPDALPDPDAFDWDAVGSIPTALVTGTIVIENVFYLPGLGRLIFQSISNRDLPTVQALVMLFAAIVVTANFVVDLLYVVIDPRLKART